MYSKNQIAIIPYPKSLKLKGSYFALTPFTYIISDSSKFEIDPIIAVLREKIESSIGFLLPVIDKLSFKGNRAIRFEFKDVESSDSCEAYILSITKSDISIQGIFKNFVFVKCVLSYDEYKTCKSDTAP